MFGLKLEKKVNMVKVQEKFKIMSVNQIFVYRTILETFNIMRRLSSEQIQIKCSGLNDKKYCFRSNTNNDLRVPNKPNMDLDLPIVCTAKLFNMLPMHLRETENPITFKTMTKHWILENISSN